MTSTKRAVCIPMANGIAMINGKFTSIHDVASTSQLRKQRPFADGWRKINVPTLDDAGDDDQIVPCVRRRSC